MSSYRQELRRAMTWLAGQPQTIFVGQSVGYPGTSVFDSLTDVPAAQKLEFPVAENMQLGFCTGLALTGLVPISVFPRWNFLLLAADQLVNHLDRLPLYSEYRPKVIIRTAIGRSRPLDPGPQHQDDFTDAFRLMCRTVQLVRLAAAEEIVPAYQAAFAATHSTILVEDGNL